MRRVRSGEVTGKGTAGEVTGVGGAGAVGLDAALLRAVLVNGAVGLLRAAVNGLKARLLRYQRFA